MKKFIAILMAALMVLSFAACSKTPVTNEEDSTAEAVVENSAEETSEDASASGSVAQTLADEFKALAATETDIKVIGDAIAANAMFADFGMVSVDPVQEAIDAGIPEADAKYLAGFNIEISGYESVHKVGPNNGVTPFIAYIFTIADGADVDAFVATLEENANLRWNFCTMADEMATEVVGNTVFFVMAPMSFEA